MGFSLFPKTVKFYELFQQQNRKLQKAAKHLNEIFQDFSDVEDKTKYINIAEAEGNRISRDIATQLALTFITPIDREDIHEINLIQEQILNLLKAIANRVALYEVPSIRYPAKKLAANLKLMMEETAGMLNALSCKGCIEPHLGRIKSLKYDCEMILLVALAETYDCEEKNFDAILEVVKWTHIYDRIEQAVDATEQLADILEGVMLKNA
jgi:uncharacterized protein Yka (UPF0111/DUF47 family)